MKVQAGQSLFLINDEQIARSISQNEASNIDALIRNKIDNIDALKQKIELPRLELSEDKVALQNAENFRQEEIDKLTPSKAIAQSKLDLASAKSSLLTVQYNAAKNNLDRFSELLQVGAVSKQTVDSASSKFAEVAGDLKAAKAELEIAQPAVTSVQNGNFYNGNGFVGNLPRLTADVKDAAQLVGFKRPTSLR